MKNLVIAILFIALPFVGIAQNDFDKYEDRKGVASMVMNQRMFKLLSKVDLNSSDPEIKEYINLVNNLENIKMFTTVDKAIASEMSTTMQAYLKGSKLEELLRAKDDDKHVKFYYKPGKNDDYVSEFVMFLRAEMDGEDRTVFFQVTGEIDLKQISKLAQEFDFEGSDALKDVEKAKKG